MIEWYDLQYGFIYQVCCGCQLLEINILNPLDELE